MIRMTSGNIRNDFCVFATTSGNFTSAYQPSIADGVMRRAKGSFRYQAETIRESCDRMNLRQLKRRFELKRRQNGRQPLGQHGLA